MNTQDPAAGYTSWLSPNGHSKVVYSLSVFGEIDALVNDGYRRIPHGGVEAGGLLLGTRSGDTLKVEAFRLISCQHALGPSFVLSDLDLSALRDQLKEVATDPELAGLIPIGWFIGHTRSPLEMNDREVSWFKEFFPEPGSLTLLVKPERFQATRFVFLLRSDDGNMERTAAGAPVILPLSVPGPSAGGMPAPSLPATKPLPRSSSEPQAVTEFPPAIPDADALIARPSWPTASEPTRIRLPKTPPPDLPGTAPPWPAAASVLAPSSEPPSIPPVYPYASLTRHRARAADSRPAVFGLRSAAVLLLAAVLGSIAGYWAYLQLPSPVIPVSVREQRNQLVVEWPAKQTENVDYAGLQVNEGQWITLSPEQKLAGRAVIDVPSGDLKIDLVAKHWLRDSRGIVRYLRTASPER